MDKYTYESMKMIMLSLAEWMNTPNEQLEEMMGISWSQFHDLRRLLEGEEECGTKET
jgi:hypothetical protein